MIRPALLIMLALTACDLSPAVPFQRRCAPHPLADRALWVDVSCAAARCAIEVEQNGCRLSFAISECEDHLLEATITPEGELEFTASAELGSCRARVAPEEALLQVACESRERACVLDLYDPAREPRFTVEALQLIDAPFRAPDSAYQHLLERFDHFSGSITGLVVDGDHLIVSAFRRNGARILCNEGSTTSHFFLINATSLVLTASVAAPDCVTRIVEDPITDGFLAVSGTVAPQLSRYTREARLVESAPIELLHARPGLHPIPSVVLADEARGLVNLVFTHVQEESAPYLMTLDATTLRPAARMPRPTYEAIHHAAYDSRGDLVATIDRRSRADLYGAADLDRRSVELLAVVPRAVSSELGHIALHPGSERLVIAAGGINPALWVFDPASELPARLPLTAVFYEHAAASWAAIPHPADDRLMIVGLTGSSTALPAHVALFDPVAGRFLPGSTPIGAGFVGQFKVGERGQIFASLPWAGAIVRLTARK